MTSPRSDALRVHYQAIAARHAAEPDMSLAARRDLVETLHLRTAEPHGVTYREIDAGGRPALWCTPVGGADDRVILYTHGGGFLFNTMHSHRKLAGHLARATGVRALVLDYRLAPEHPFPAQLDDTVAAYRWLLDSGIDPGHLATAGDSAGGNLATSAVLRLRDEGMPLPAAIVGFSPWYDLEGGGETIETNAATDATVSRSVVLAMARLFLGRDGVATDPLANPLYADPSGLPPMYLTVGTQEVLQDNAERFARVARAVGVEVEIDLNEGMQHIHVIMAGRAPEADATLARTAKWLKVRLGLA